MVIHDVRSPMEAIERSLDSASLMMQGELKALSTMTQQCFHVSKKAEVPKMDLRKPKNLMVSSVNAEELKEEEK